MNERPGGLRALGLRGAELDTGDRDQEQTNEAAIDQDIQGDEDKQKENVAPSTDGRAQLHANGEIKRRAGLL